MKKIVFLLIVSSLMFISCKKDDDGIITIPPNDRNEQYLTDGYAIEEYLKSNYMVVDSDMNVTMNKITNPFTQVSIWNQTEYPLQSIIVKNDVRDTYKTDGRFDDPVDYKLYYIILNEGGGERPTTIDSSFVDYRGWNLSNVEFDRTSNPVWTSFPGNIEFISGFRQILPKLKSAESVVENGDGTLTHINFGNCIVFIPSGLGYFNLPRGTNLPGYSNLVFQIKLKGIHYNDHDRDRILSKYELYNGQTDYFLQDSDGDGFPDFLDSNDDGDNVITKNELKIPGTTPQQYYQFNDIPDCSGNQTNTSRLRRHLDPSCFQ